MAGKVCSQFGILSQSGHCRCQEGTAWAARFPEGNTARQDMSSMSIVPSASRRCLRGMVFADSPSFLRRGKCYLACKAMVRLSLLGSRTLMGTPSSLVSCQLSHNSGCMCQLDRGTELPFRSVCQGRSTLARITISVDLLPRNSSRLRISCKPHLLSSPRSPRDIRSPEDDLVHRPQSWHRNLEGRPTYRRLSSSHPRDCTSSLWGKRKCLRLQEMTLLRDRELLRYTFGTR